MSPGAAAAPLFAGRYHLMRRLAVGGMGEIVLARREHDGALVVVKRLLAHLADDPAFARMFRDEVRIAQGLHHPNIVAVFDAGEADGVGFMVMEYLDGANLAQVMTRAVQLGRALKLGTALAILADVAAGAHHAHGLTAADGTPAPVIHRDLAPRNIVVTVDGWAKILDFGVAKASSQTEMTIPGRIKGTPSYLAPEQITGKPVDPRSDIFTLGTLLFELTTLRRLFRRSSPVETMRAVLRGEVPPPTRLVHGYPPELEAIVLRCLRRSPEERPESAGALRAELLSVIEGLGIQETRAELGRDIAALVGEQEVDRTVVEPLLSDATAASGDDDGDDDDDARDGRGHSRGNLPVHLTVFVGRSEEVEWVARAVGRTRLVVLRAGPGAGKTRLATECGALLAPDFPGGVWLCRLSAARTPEDMARAVASALSGDAPGATADPLPALLAALPPALLILDGGEGVTEPLAAALPRWLESAPDLRTIVTTRHRLPVAEQLALDVAPLAVPDAQEPGQTTDAVTLFVERSRAVRPEFRPTPKEIATIGDIVRTLDGNPLALELAARRSSNWLLHSLLEGLQDPFPVLDPMAVPGENTLSDAIRASWDLLGPMERRALAQCTVFAGGFDVEAAGAVLDLGAGPEVPWAADVLQRLSDCSLLTAEEEAGRPGGVRCDMAWTIRAFARERLQAGGDEAATLRRHAAYYRREAERWAEEARAEHWVEGRRRLQREAENVRAALERALKASVGAPAGAAQPAADGADRARRQAALEEALGLAVCLLPDVALRGPLSPYIDQLAGLLARATADGLAPAALLAARFALGRALRLAGDLHGAEHTLERLREDAGIAPELLARTQTELAGVSLLRGAPAAAAGLASRSLLSHREHRAVVWQGRALDILGRALLANGDSARAQAAHEHALRRVRALGDPVGEGVCLARLAQVLQAAGQLEQARAHLERSLALQRPLDAPRLEAQGLLARGVICHEQGLLDEARRSLDSALRAFRRAGDRRGEALACAHDGLVRQDAGELGASIRRLTTASAALLSSGDRRVGAAVAGALAAARACAGDSKAAADGLAEARACAAQAEDPTLTAILDVHAAFVTLGGLLAAPPEVQAAGRSRVKAALGPARALCLPGTGGRSDLIPLLRLSVGLVGRALRALPVA